MGGFIAGKQQVPRCVCGDVVFVELAHVVLVDEPSYTAAISSVFSTGEAAVICLGSSRSDLYARVAMICMERTGPALTSHSPYHSLQERPYKPLPRAVICVGGAVCAQSYVWAAPVICMRGSSPPSMTTAQSFVWEGGSDFARAVSVICLGPPLRLASPSHSALVQTNQ